MALGRARLWDMLVPERSTGIGIKSEFYSNADCFAMPEIDYTERGVVIGKEKQNKTRLFS